MKKSIVLFVVLLIAVAYFAMEKKAAESTVSRIADPSSLRETDNGAVVGFRDQHDTFAWLGIPFAKAPLGELRWRAPQAANSWSDPLQALQEASVCTQFWGPLASDDGDEGDVIGSEDCLYLNVWSPRFANQDGAAKLPVMVWIHGGGNTIGTANTYRGNRFAGEQNVIFVAMNYRLGLFGWFSHEALRNTAPTRRGASGNYGTMDIIAALQWVQDNIDEFGGDPDNVTIYGESAGGRNVFSLIASPLASGLFHKAISQSGSTLSHTQALAENYVDDRQPGLELSSSEVLLKLLHGLPDVAGREAAKEQLASMNKQAVMKFLRDKRAEEILAVIEDAPMGMYSSPQIIGDGYVIPKTSLQTRFAEGGDYNRVPMILGTNRDETKLFMMSDPRYTSQLLGFLPRIRDESEYNRDAAYFSDQWKALSVDEPARAIIEHGSEPIYSYRFEWDETPSNFLVDMPALLGAAHGLEVPFVFGNFDSYSAMAPLFTEESRASREQLANEMMSYWAAFAYSGDPGRGRNDEQTLWSEWQPEGVNVMVFDTEADGGNRMEEIRISAADLKQRMINDASQSDQKARCQLYAEMFLTSYQTTDFWKQEEYEQWGDGGCSDYPPRAFD